MVEKTVGWRATKLWEYVEKSTEEGHPVRRTLGEAMPAIETVLAKGGTASQAFTLHDADHGLRVARRMAELMPRPVGETVNVVEAALLLLAAFLHDIGMTPPGKITSKIHSYLLTGDRSLLTSRERADLQKWLDTKKGGLTPPIEANRITPSGVAEVEEILTYYCRDRHNDWSEEWMRANLPDLGPGLYPTWIDDLVTLCRSHHESLPELRDKRFDAREVGSPAHVVNLRYLAALLRVADVLEFDPERTPEVVLNHRDIPPGSRVFWHKDHHITFTMAKDGSTLLFTARTPYAAIHRGVLQTADQVDEELATCSTLHSEGAFRRGHMPHAERSRYDWPWPARLIRDIEEKDDSFIYIDGAFRPDTGKILTLLSGTALYGNPMAAVRELIQNAVDAVREQIAHERLSEDDPESSEWAERLGQMHKVRLAFEKDADGYWLSCTDDGVGMTREIIEKHLLVSGSAMRPEVRALERLAEEKNFSVGRTGQFGIGVLSYFMIADRMEITTRRSIEGGGINEKGWHFTTEGLGAFGELRPAQRTAKGTMVRLHLTKDQLGDAPDAWSKKLLSYVKETVRRVPCRLEVVDERNSGEKWKAGPGWTARVEEHAPRIVEQLAASVHSRKHLLTSSELQSYERADQHWAGLREKALRALRWMEPVALDLPNKFGHLRATLPYFELGEDACLAFMDVDGDLINPMPDQREIFVGRGESLLSWRGFSTGGKDWSRSLLISEVDLARDGVISVNRRKLQVHDDEPIRLSLEKAERTLAADFLQKFKTSRYALLNERIVGSVDSGFSRHVLGVGSSNKWKRNLSSDSNAWNAIELPAVELQASKYEGHSVNRWAWLGHEIATLPYLRVTGYEIIALSPLLVGGRIVVSDSWSARLAVLWTGMHGSEPKGAPPSSAVAFPPEWNDLALIITGIREFWNASHPFVRLCSDWESAPESEDADESHAVAAALGRAACDPQSARRWVFQRLGRSARYWNALRDNFRDQFSSLLSAAGVGSLSRPLMVWDCSDSGLKERMMSLSLLGANEMERIVSGKGIVLPDDTVLPWPKDEEWWLRRVKGADADGKRAAPVGGVS